MVVVVKTIELGSSGEVGENRIVVHVVVMFAVAVEE